MTLAILLMLGQLVAVALVSRRARPSVRRWSDAEMVRRAVELDAELDRRGLLQ